MYISTFIKNYYIYTHTLVHLADKEGICMYICTFIKNYYYIHTHLYTFHFPGQHVFFSFFLLFFGSVFLIYAQRGSERLGWIRAIEGGDVERSVCDGGRDG